MLTLTACHPQIVVLTLGPSKELPFHHNDLTFLCRFLKLLPSCSGVSDGCCLAAPFANSLQHCLLSDTHLGTFRGIQFPLSSPPLVTTLVNKFLLLQALTALGNSRNGYFPGKGDLSCGLPRYCSPQISKPQLWRSKTPLNNLWWPQDLCHTKDSTTGFKANSSDMSAQCQMPFALLKMVPTTSTAYSHSTREIL